MNQKKTSKKITIPHFFKLLLNPDRLLLIFFTKSRRHFITRVAILLTKIGNGQIYLIFSIGVFIVDVPIGLSFMTASILQVYLQVFLKKLFKRTRPYVKYQDLDNLYTPPDPYSFPSGHTCAAFTIFFVARLVLPALSPYFLILAIGIALSRIYLAVHYPSDIIGGIIVAYFATQLGIKATMLATGAIL